MNAADALGVRTQRGQWWLRLQFDLDAGIAQLLHKPSPGIAFNEHHVGHGDIVFAQACKLGIVSKRLGSLYRSGRSKQWLKVKNPAAPAGAARGRGRVALNHKVAGYHEAGGRPAGGSGR